MNTPDLESMLRAAPQPPVPASLQERLVNQVRLDRAASTGRQPMPSAGWLQRWWPTLLAGGGILACAATLITQQREIRHLQEVVASIQFEGTRASAAIMGFSSPVAADTVSTIDEARSEILSLRAERTERTARNDAARQLADENRQLENQITLNAGVSPEELAILDEALDKVRSIKCVNNMKNIGLAIRVWANDHQNSFPSDLLSLTRELGTPKMLICPSDPRPVPAPDWATFNRGQISYEFLNPGGTEREFTCVAARCPYHQNLLLSDGSVQMSYADGSNLTSRLVSRDGKLYLE